MTRRKVKRRTITSGVCFDPVVFNRIMNIPNRSHWINQAIKEKLERETTKEGKILMLKEKKRSLAKQMQEVDVKLKDARE